MDKVTKGNHLKRISMLVIVVICTFLIVYLAGAFYDASMRYAQAETIAKKRAHTRIGREGYEYIFDPETQILLDKILPNRNLIISNIVLLDYLPLNINYLRELLDKDVYLWMQLGIFYSHDPKPVIIRLIVYASIAALLTGTAVYLLSKPSRNR